MLQIENLNEAFKSLVDTYGGEQPITLQHISSLLSIMAEKNFDQLPPPNDRELHTLPAYRLEKLINLRINDKNNLTIIQFNLASEEQKLKYCNIAIERNKALDPFVWNWASDEIKLDNCNRSIEKNGCLYQYQFAWAPDDLKLADCNIMIENSWLLYDYQFAWAPDDIKLKDCNTRIARYGYISDKKKNEWYEKKIN